MVGPDVSSSRNIAPADINDFYEVVNRAVSPLRDEVSRVAGLENNMERQRWEARADSKVRYPGVKQHAARYDSEEIERAHQLLWRNKNPWRPLATHSTNLKSSSIQRVDLDTRSVINEIGSLEAFIKKEGARITPIIAGLVCDMGVDMNYR